MLHLRLSVVVVIAVVLLAVVAVRILSRAGTPRSSAVGFMNHVADGLD